jgi:hypothetical protein
MHLRSNGIGDGSVLHVVVTAGSETVTFNLAQPELTVTMMAASPPATRSQPQAANRKRKVDTDFY